MGRRANPTLIGAFLVGAVALIAIGTLVFARGQFLTEKRTFVLYFNGSVKGLNVGAPVDFKGVRVGSVTDIQVQYLTKEGEFRIPVFIEIEPGRVSQVGVRKTREESLKLYQAMIEQGLRAQLGTVSLVTGQLYVQLDFYPGSPVKLAGADPDVPELPTIPTTLQQASQAVQDLLEKIGELPLDQLFANVLGITQGLNQLVNAPEVFALIRSLEGTSVTLQQLVQRIDGQVARLLEELGGTSGAARTLTTDLQQLVRQLNTRVGPLADGAKETLDVARVILKDGQQLVRHVDGHIGRLTDGLANTTKVAQTTLVHTQRTLDGDLSHALQEMTAAMRAIRLLADYLERNPNALVYGKGGDRR